MIWSQNYTPVADNLGLSTLIAAVPAMTLLALLGIWRVKAHLAALAGVVMALGIAIGIYGMPTTLALTAAGYGACFGLFPIGWILLNAIFVYNISVESGGFNILQKRMADFSQDRRIQALMIAFGFGAFLEGFAGFGAPVAITCGLMIGLGFRPMEAAKLALIGNTAPVAYGSVGIPIVTLAKVTGLDEAALSAMVGRHLPFFALVVPFWLVAMQAGWRAMREVWPACLVAGASFALAQFVVSNFYGPYLVDAAAGLAAICSLVLLLKVWSPPVSDEPSTGSEASNAAVKRTESESQPSEKLRAWLPWILLTVFVTLSCLGPVKTVLDHAFAAKIEVPQLHMAVQKVPPVVASPQAEPAVFAFNLLSATGTALLVAGLLAGIGVGLKPVQIARTYVTTVKRVRMPLLTISLMLSLGFTTRYSGSDSTLGLALASTGALFPFFSPLLGWLGVAITGSDTSSNVLFGNLQKVTAEQLNLSPILTAAANSSGGVMGKMINPQNLVVASVAVSGQKDSPDAGTILRAVFWHSIALAALMGILVMIQAYVFKWMIVATPTPAP